MHTVPKTLAAFPHCTAIPIACIKKTVDLGLPDSIEILLPTLRTNCKPFGPHGPIVSTQVGTISKSCSSCSHFLCQFGLLCPFCYFSKVIRWDIKVTWGKGVVARKVPHHALSHSPEKNCHSIWPFSIRARYSLRLQNCRNMCRLQCFPHQVVYMRLRMSGDSSRSLPTAWNHGLQWILPECRKYIHEVGTKVNHKPTSNLMWTTSNQRWTTSPQA